MDPRTRTTLQRLLSLARPYAAVLAGASVLMLLASGATLALPLAARAAIDRMLRTHQGEMLDRLALALVALIVLMFGASFGDYLAAAYVGNRVVRELRARVF